MAFGKRFLLFLVIILAIIAAFNYQLLEYGIGQARGQLKIVREAKPNEEWLMDPNFPDSLKAKVLLVQDVKRFAFDSLGINYTNNYSSMYDQQGKPLMFVVTACPRYKLEPVEFRFPFLGTFTYKGFFDEQKANKLEMELKEAGYDTDIRTAGGWSTLGWFEDPILSEMLMRGSGYLAETIIHELTHGTLFVKDSLKFNENLATFIGSHGARLFLRNKFGENSKEYLDYMAYWADRRLYLNHMLRGARYLDAMYQSFSDDASETEKSRLKKKAIGKIISSLDTLQLNDIERYHRFLSQKEINNTFFMSYVRYHGEIELLEKELHEKFDGDIKQLLEAYKSRYPSL